MAQRRFKSLDDCRKYLGTVVNRMEESTGGEVDAALGGRLAYVINILAGLIKDGDLEQRIRRLEDQFGGKS